STYDRDDDKLAQDITTTVGFLHLLKKVLRLRRGALYWRWIYKLRNKMSKEKRAAFKEAAGKIVTRKRTGTRHLRKTQEYPVAFAKAIATLHLEDVEKAKDPPGLTLNGIQKANLVCPGDWSEANLAELRDFLILEARNGTWKPIEGLPF
ncbi:unnamed protein product, partial [Symbiodinium pilosum]